MFRKKSPNAAETKNSEVKVREEWVDRQKGDSITAATVVAFVDDSSSVLVSMSDHAPDLMLDPFSVSALDSGGASVSSFTSSGMLECGANWCTVVNGTRYVGHMRSGRSSVSKLEMEESVVDSPQETKKERNRRLLKEDRKNQSVRGKNRQSKRPDKCKAGG